MSDRLVKVGGPVIYHDEHGVPRDALVTAIHGQGNTPCINLLVVSSDPSMQDQYGRQITRVSSCSHMDPAHTAWGRYWRYADEEPAPYTPSQV